MAERLPFFPDVPAFPYRIVLDEVRYELRYVWDERRQSWYLDISAADGTPLLRGRRIVPYTSHTRGIIPTGGPPGILTAIGANPYARDELTIVYVPEAELSDLPAALTEPLTPRTVVLDG